MDHENDTAWIREQLYPGEALLWTGAPGKGHFLRKEDAFLIPFSILWCGFAVYWETGVIADGAPLMFRIWGVPFVLMGLYITVGRFIVRKLRDQHTRYALTDRRLVAKTGKTCRSMDLDRLPCVTVTRRADGSGDIRYGEASPRYGFYNELGFWNGADQNALLTLRNIPDVNSVKLRIENAAARRRDPTSF